MKFGGGGGDRATLQNCFYFFLPTEIYVLSYLSFTYGTIPNIFPHKKMSRCATVYCVTYCNLTELTVYCMYVTERQLCSAETVLVG